MRNLTIALVMTTLVIFALGCGDKEEAAAPTVSEATHYTTIDAALAALGTDDKPLVVDFYTDWCHWCKVLDTVTYIDPAVIKFFDEEMLLVKVNAEVDTALTQKYHVSGYPTLVMINKDGEEIDRLVGYAEPTEFMEIFRNYANGIGTLDDLLNKAKDSTDRALFYEIADKYRYRGGSEESKVWFQRVIDEGDARDSLAGECRLALADTERRAKNYEAAIAAYKEVAKDFKGMMAGEDAEIWTAIAYRQSGDTAAAISQFEKFVADYPTSEDGVAYATEQIEKLKNPPAPEAEGSN